MQLHMIGDMEILIFILVHQQDNNTTLLRANLATCDLHCDTAISVNPHKQVKEFKDRTILVVQA